MARMMCSSVVSGLTVSTCCGERQTVDAWYRCRPAPGPARLTALLDQVTVAGAGLRQDWAGWQHCPAHSRREYEVSEVVFSLIHI